MTRARFTIPGLHDGVPERLERAGRSPRAISALLEVDQSLFMWRRALVKGELVATVLAQLGGEVEVAEFAALASVMRIVHGLGLPGPGEATVGALAQEMGVHPSRASRLAGQLTARGYLRREVAQEDARRAVLAPTRKALDLMSAFRERKWDRYDDVFAGWSDEELVTFAGLLTRYLEASRKAQEAGAAGQGGDQGPEPALP